MAGNLTILPGTLEDVLDLTLTMREDDRRECRAATGNSPAQALVDSFQRSRECWCARVDGEVLAIYGVVGEGSVLGGGGLGVVWMLTSTLVEKFPMLFWRTCKAELAKLVDRWRCLFNLVDCRYERAFRWANRLGFYINEPEAWGPSGLPFSRIQISRGDIPWA